MKYIILFFLCIFLSCSENPLTVTKTDGDMNYSSLIGTTWYCDENLAAIFDDLTYNSHTIEKWQFYQDSIVVIATHYNRTTMMALDQFKYIAELSQIDRVWKDEHTGEVWRTTTSWWKQYARSSTGCTWVDIIDQQNGPFNLIVNDMGKKDTIGFGDYESNSYYQLTKTRTQLVYPTGWIGFACGYIQ